MSNDYADQTTEDVVELEWPESVRKRPGMYIGSTSIDGVYHCVRELIDNAMDEALIGACDEVTVELNDGIYSVSDNGRGMPVEPDESGESGISKCVVGLHRGTKFDNNTYKVSGGLHGVGSAAVNALSDHFVVTVDKHGKRHRQTFSRGTADSDREIIDDSVDRTGTTIEFSPDEDIFSETTLEPDRIRNWLEELACLNPGVTITLEYEDDDGGDVTETFHSEDGVVDYLETIGDEYESVNPPYELHEEIDYEVEGDDGKTRTETLYLDCALQWTSDTSPEILSFANNINTTEGGKHVTGFKRALTRLIREIKAEQEYKSNMDFETVDIRRGLKCVLSVQVPGAEFKSQTKDKLINEGIQSIVYEAVKEKLKDEINDVKKYRQNVLQHIKEAVKQREEIEEIQEVAPATNGSSSGTTKPAGLAQASVEPTELFMCEGDSAGGSAKKARDRETQAVLPLQGKPKNAIKHNKKSVVKNSITKDIANTLNIGFKGLEDYRPDELEYDRLIILADADDDGDHIVSLLLAFFYVGYPELYENGVGEDTSRIHIAVPPLYQVKYNSGESDYLYSEAEKDDLDDASVARVTYLKGLGEMDPKDLGRTALNPDTRRLVEVSIDDAHKAKESVELCFDRGTVSDRKDEYFARH